MDTLRGQTGVPEPAASYPRPLLERPSETWASLNGEWQLDRTPTSFSDPPFGLDLDERILVPYPIESPLSGVRNLTEAGFAWYRLVASTTGLLSQPPSTTTSSLDSDDVRTLLHFEASDYNTTVFVNGVAHGWHSGGYDPFSFDITDALALSGNSSSSSCSSDDDAADDAFPQDLDGVQCKGLTQQVSRRHHANDVEE